ncbi:sensor histidine kinase [Roseateles oligotrophus]|uniref:histidine kinase n=1 Tax=Roseateles oligotrophus TaxID=1769250 RepID=A0ABT2YI60_9BURK|nr:histidine kinase dimerization/phosphoacceptor domain -containing protein [Roseateles oligotrophus]MCV2369749.1 PAS domain-containing protein [Roseateles oligotrophus]
MNAEAIQGRQRRWWQRWATMSLRQTLFFGAGLGILLPALLLGYFEFIAEFERNIELYARGPLHTHANVLERGMAEPVWVLDRESAAELAAAVMSNPDVMNVTVLDGYKRTFTQNQRPVPAGAELFREERAIKYKGELIGSVIIELSTARIRQELRTQMLKQGFALTAQVLISLSLIWLLINRRLLRPLRELQNDVSRWASGALDRPATPQRADEMGQLALGLDTMRAELSGLLAQHERAEVAQRQISDRLALATRAGGVGIWDYDVATNELVWDAAMYGLYGIAANRNGDAYKTWRNGFHPDDQARGEQEIQLALAGHKEFDTEFRVQWPNAEVRNIRALAIVQRDGDGVPLRMIGTNWDITAQKQTEVALQSSLREKTALLLEVHHRVKNNLQVINSLLRMEGRRNEHAQTKAVLKDMQVRVRSIALLHETIYRKGSFSSIDLGTYIAQLADQSLAAMLAVPGSVQLRLALGSLQVGLDQATPCGMLISELISNCLKHGFPDGRSGEICMELHCLDAAAKKWRLRLSDTGIGLAADFESRRQQSLGLQLVADLAKQMGGALYVGAGPQAVFTVDFEAEAPAAIVIKLAADDIIH